MARFKPRSRQIRQRPPSSRGRSDVGGILVGALAILLGSTAVGTAVNHFSPRGIPLLPERPQAPLSPALSLPPGISTIDAQQARSALDDEAALFLDARSSVEYAEGHIPAALNLPPDEFEDRYPDLAHLVEAAPALVVYCQGIECSEAAHLAERLREVCERPIYVFELGWRAWLGSGGRAREGPEP